MSDDDGADALVRFFESLPPEARREYQALARKDLEYGEDPFAEKNERLS